MTGQCCGDSSCSDEEEPTKISAKLEVKATASLDEEVEAELDLEDGSLAELLEEEEEDA
jgi:hypothetical protein